MADPRRVNCVKLGRELPGLEKPPFAGELGQKVFESVSKEAWDQWQAESVKVMRERGWSMGDPQHRKQLMAAMKAFLFEQPVTPPGLAPTGPPPEGMVNCVKIGRQLPALRKPPFKGPLGERIFANVSEQGWKLWEDQAKILMNHHGLSMADPEARAFLNEQMEEFFFGAGARMPADWVPPGAGGGKGGGGKGAPGPRRK